MGRFNDPAAYCSNVQSQSRAPSRYYTDPSLRRWAIFLSVKGEFYAEYCGRVQNLSIRGFFAVLLLLVHIIRFE
jgi:hypothetical protein